MGRGASSDLVLSDRKMATAEDKKRMSWLGILGLPVMKGVRVSFSRGNFGMANNTVPLPMGQYMQDSWDRDACGYPQVKNMTISFFMWVLIFETNLYYVESRLINPSQMPYLHWEAHRIIEKMAQIVNKTPLPGAQPIDPYARETEGSSREETLYHKHLRTASPLHVRRTLDQYYYWTLDDTSKRDGDQVVYRATQSSDEGARIIMVDQLWLWILDCRKLSDLQSFIWSLMPSRNHFNGSSSPRWEEQQRFFWYSQKSSWQHPYNKAWISPEFSYCNNRSMLSSVFR